LGTGKKRRTGELIFLILVVLLATSCGCWKISGVWKGVIELTCPQGYAPITKYIALLLDCSGGTISGKADFLSSLSEEPDFGEYASPVEGEMIGDGARISIRVKRWDPMYSSIHHDYGLDGDLYNNTLSGSANYLQWCANDFQGGCDLECSGTFSLTKE
jgi:hypothetical protein